MIAASGIGTSKCFAGVEAEVEVLAQQLRRERHLEVEVDERGRLVARERRAHHALVHELEERVARHAGLLRQHGDLGQRLRDHAEEHVVADLHDARQLALADVARAGAIIRRYGSARVERGAAARSTRTTAVPALITFALPDTGAASSSTPRAASSARSSAEPSSEIDEHSTTSFGARRPGQQAARPATTSRTSSHVDTMTNTTSHAARSATRSAIFAPWWRAAPPSRACGSTP